MPESSEAIPIADPPRFLDSLKALRGSPGPQPFQSVLGSLPFDPSGEGDLKRQIRLGRAEGQQAPDRAHLLLALFTLSGLEEMEIDLLCGSARERNREMLSRLVGPEDDDDGDDWEGDGEGPGAPEGPPVARPLSEKHALALYRAWLRLAKDSLRPGDRLLAGREEFQELLGKSLPGVPDTKEQYLYHEHNL
jgi:hypothetical protein